MAESVLLTLLLATVVASAALAPWIRDARVMRAATMAAMLAVAAIAVALVVGFDGTPFAVTLGALPALALELRFGVDGFNLYLVLLTALVLPVVLGCAWPTAEARSRLYLALLLALEAALLGTFLARNLLVLFVLWEAVLIPMIVMIVVFGGRDRRRAALGFFLYTMAGSVLFLAAVILLGDASLRATGHWSYDLSTLYALKLAPGEQTFVFLAIALACAVKTPLVPFHAWLPLAYVEASPSATALMASVMSKMGPFGFAVLAIPLCPDAAARFAPWLVALSAAGIVYGAVLALRAPDPKRLVAYASLSHMGYIVLGLFAGGATALHGALFQMLSHGVIVAGLFLMLGLLEQRRGIATAADALATRAPRLAVVLMLFVLASLALPLTSGFTAEFLVLQGALGSSLGASGSAALLGATLVAATGVVLGATYMLRFARDRLFAASGTPSAALPDLRVRELLALVPLLGIVGLVGIAPAPWMAKVEPTVAQRAAAPASPAPRPQPGLADLSPTGAARVR